MLKMTEEYYVYDKFMADGGKKNEFVIVNEMLYEKLQAYKLQKKGFEKRDTLMVFPDSHGLIESAMSNFYP